LKTILIVEDTELNVDLMTQLLEEDYHLVFATDGEQGVVLANEKNPDLILMDISLPVMDGYEATRKIRETMKSVPIIGLSAHAMNGHVEKAKEAGCDDYLTKPINDELLFRMLEKYLGGAE
jgi:CheY-like chemotaxis protein